jgi:hypothetical protein
MLSLLNILFNFCQPQSYNYELSTFISRSTKLVIQLISWKTVMLGKPTVAYPTNNNAVLMASKIPLLLQQLTLWYVAPICAQVSERTVPYTFLKKNVKSMYNK